MASLNPLRWIKRLRRDAWAVVSVRRGIASRVVLAGQRSGPPRLIAAELEPYKGSEVDALARLRKSAQLERYRCATILGLGDYQMLQVEPPQVPEAEIKTAIRWTVKGMLEFPVDEATIDVLPVPVQEGRNASMFVICAANKEIERSVRLYQEAKVPLEVIDIPETAQRNIAARFEPEGRGVAMVGFYQNGGLLTFTAGGDLYSVRRFDITLEQLIEADDSQRQSLYERILLELQRSLDAFEHQFHFVSVAKMLVSPLPESVDLRDYLSANLYIPVETADLTQVIDISAVPAFRDPGVQARLLGLIGVALRGEAELA